MPPTTDSLRDRHKTDTRDALVTAALTAFDERGYTQVTVEEICRDAGVSSRTFFRYFPNKDEVLAAPITQLLDTVRVALAGQDAAGTVWSGLRAALLSAADLVETRRETFLAVSRVIRDQPGVLASNARAFTDWEEATRELVAARLGAAPDDLSPRLLLGVTMCALRAALDIWTRSAGRDPLIALLERALDEVAPGARAIERSATRHGQECSRVDH